MVLDPCLYAGGWATQITSDFYYMVWRINKTNFFFRNVFLYLFMFIF